MTYSLEFEMNTELIGGLAALVDGRLEDARMRCRGALRAAASARDELRGSHALALGLGVEAAAAERARARRRPDDEAAALAAARALDADWERLVAGLDQIRTPSRVIAGNLATAAAERLRLAGRSEPRGWAVAAAAWDAVGMPYPAAYGRLRGAEALIAAGGSRAEPTALLSEAHAACVRMGAAAMREEVEALARRARIELGQPASPASPEPDPSPAGALGISERELDVLALVAEGRTNRQIADALFISVKTTGAHVSSILRKLDVATRGEAAAVAVRSGLLPTGSGPVVRDRK
jgi:DNA-binding CsgD family transcriptional regulator